MVPQCPNILPKGRTKRSPTSDYAEDGGWVRRTLLQHPPDLLLMPVIQKRHLN